MAKQFYGISALTQNYAKTTNITDVDKEIVSVRVLDIILDDSHPEFEKYGGWNGVGTIFYDTIGVPSGLDNINIAYPLSPMNKFYPLVNELVPLVFLTSTDSQLNTSRTTAYYLPPINLWNSQHHNALPDSTGEGFDQNTLQDYQQAEQGNPRNVRRVNDGATDIDLGEGFEIINVLIISFKTFEFGVEIFSFLIELLMISFVISIFRCSKSFILITLLIKYP